MPSLHLLHSKFNPFRSRLVDNATFTLLTFSLTTPVVCIRMLPGKFVFKVWGVRRRVFQSVATDVSRAATRSLFRVGSASCPASCRSAFHVAFLSAPCCIPRTGQVLIISLTNGAESQRGGAGRTTNDTCNTPQAPHKVLSCISRLLGSRIELKPLELPGSPSARFGGRAP
jgi:hypothetical protein